MRVALLACVSLVALAAVAPADCAPSQPPAVALGQAEAVFVGRVVAAGSRGDWLAFEFEADFAWKGVAGRRVTVLSSEPRCGGGYGFEVGKAYLVYAHRHPAGLRTTGQNRSG